MPNDWVIHGVPLAIAKDGWWLANPQPPATPGIQTARRPWIALLLLIALADLLFYRQTLGLSLALFALAIFAATMTSRPRPRALALLTLSVLPVVDYVQPLSLAILVLGLPAALVLNRPAPQLPAFLGLLSSLPLRGLRDATTGLRRQLSGPRSLRPWVSRWAFPLGGALVLLSLLAEANPILDDWLAQLTRLPLHPVDLALRVSFWAGIALLLWPLLASPPPPLPIRATTAFRPKTGLNAGSVTRALIGFNLILGLQTLMDARLPLVWRRPATGHDAGQLCPPRRLPAARHRPSGRGLRPRRAAMGRRAPRSETPAPALARPERPA